jgi:outer membrane protein TolC
VAGDDFFSGDLTIRLPVDRGKWRERIAERAAMLRRAKAEQRSVLAQLRDAAASAFADLDRADGEVALLESGLVPQAHQSLESNRSGYQVDKIDFLSLIDSQVKLLDAELSLVRAVADRRAAFAALEGVVGEELR